MSVPRWIYFSPIALLLALPVESQLNSPPATTNVAADALGAIAPGTGVPLPSKPILAAEHFGDNLMKERRFQEALTIYQSVSNPTAKLWSRMGDAHQMLLQFQEAVRCYKTSLKLEPTSAVVSNNLATTYDQLGEHERAERLYRRAIALDPHSAAFRKNLGTNLLAQQRFEEGSEAYREALQIDPRILDNEAEPSMPLPHPLNAETNYARARSCAQAGITGCTLVYLRKALDEGSATPGRVTSDKLFEAMRNTPEVQQLLTEQH